MNRCISFGLETKPETNVQTKSMTTSYRVCSAQSVPTSSDQEKGDRICCAPTQHRSLHLLYTTSLQPNNLNLKQGGLLTHEQLHRGLDQKENMKHMFRPSQSPFRTERALLKACQRPVITKKEKGSAVTNGTVVLKLHTAHPENCG